MTTLVNNGLRLLLITKNKNEADKYVLESSKLDIALDLVVAHDTETAESTLNNYSEQTQRWLLLIDIDEDPFSNWEPLLASFLQLDSFHSNEASPYVYILSGQSEDDAVFRAAKHPNVRGFIQKSKPLDDLKKALRLTGY